jgi:hypothetical protein
MIRNAHRVPSRHCVRRRGYRHSVSGCGFLRPSESRLTSRSFLLATKVVCTPWGEGFARIVVERQPRCSVIKSKEIIMLYFMLPWIIFYGMADVMREQMTPQSAVKRIVPPR